MGKVEKVSGSGASAGSEKCSVRLRIELHYFFWFTLGRTKSQINFEFNWVTWVEFFGDDSREGDNSRAV